MRPEEDMEGDEMRTRLDVEQKARNGQNVRSH